MAPVGEEEDEDSLYGKPQVLSTLILCSTPMLIQSNTPYSKCHRDVPEKYQYLDIYPKIREWSNLRCVTRTQSITEPKPKFFSPIPEPEPYPAPSWKHPYHATPSHPPNHLHPSETYSRAWLAVVQIKKETESGPQNFPIQLIHHFQPLQVLQPQRRIPLQILQLPQLRLQLRTQLQLQPQPQLKLQLRQVFIGPMCTWGPIIG